MPLLRGKPCQLSHKDQNLLRWFFGPGASKFERSPLHGILQKASMYDNHDARIEQYRSWRSEMTAAENDVGAAMAGVMFGWEPSSTANITAETKVAPNIPDNEKALIKTARASRGLNRLSAIRSDGYSVMALVFGPGSEVWSLQGFPLGGLYRMTKPGEKLIRKVVDERTQSANKTRIQLPHLLHNDLRAAEHIRDGERIALYGASDGAAARLLAEVSSVWIDLHRKPQR